MIINYFVDLHKVYREDEHEEEVPRKQVVMPITVKDWQVGFDVISDKSRGGVTSMKESVKVI